MAVTWIKSKFPGVRYYEHPTRKNGIAPDRYFAIRYQKNGKRIEEGLGWASEEKITLEDANERLSELRKAARTGEGERSLREKREKREAAELERIEREKQEITVDQLIADYIEKHAKRKKARWQEDQRSLLKDVSPLWGTRKIKDIRRRDATELLEGIVQRGAPVQACNVLEKCRKMFNLAIKWGYIEANPFAGQERPAPRPEKERVLTIDEIKTFWEALDGETVIMSEEMRRALKLILVTGQRPGEVIGMHRREIDGKWWTIPKERAKNNRAHRVYLTDTALELIGNAKGFIFPSPTKEEIDGKKIEKPIDVNAMARALRRNTLGCDKPDKRIKGTKGRKKHYAAKKAAEPVNVNKIGVGHFTPHDLRRTCLTGLARLKVPYEVRERVVNHSLGKLEKTYNLHDYEDEKAVAMQRWEGEIKRITTGQVAKVVNLYPQQ